MQTNKWRETTQARQAHVQKWERKGKIKTHRGFEMRSGPRVEPLSLCGPDKWRIERPAPYYAHILYVFYINIYIIHITKDSKTHRRKCTTGSSSQSTWLAIEPLYYALYFMLWMQWKRSECITTEMRILNRTKLRNCDETFHGIYAHMWS